MKHAEYIEREAVMQKFADHVKRSNNSDFAPAPTWNEAVQIVEEFPAADVRPVVRGRWEWEDDGEDMHYYCSCCHHNAYGCTCEILDGKYNFCPNCGADMRPQPPKEET